MATIGIDIASVDGNGTPNWQAAIQQGGLRFVGLRAIYGVTPDPWYPTYRTQLDAIGIPNFPYLLLIPNLSTPEVQAGAALAIVGTLNNHYFPIALDVEGSRNGLTAVEWLDWVTRAYTVIKNTIGVPPLLYTSQEYWMDPDGMNNLPAPQLADALGWWKYWPWAVNTPAVYDSATVDALAPPPVPPPWGNAWGLQQYMGDAVNYPGFKSTTDMDRVNVQQQGAQGDSVKWIQKRLPGLVVDGIFGPATAAAVKAFQAQKKIAVDGIVGLDTTQLLSWVPPSAAA
jgi:peptidoglycan hydrolase-like protein with peptidoglycan-binding domain